MTIAQELMKAYLESLDDQLATEVSDKHSVVNRQSRTINFCFGPVTFQRRYYQGLGFYLDHHLKIKPRRRLSAYLRLMMAKLGQVTTMRNAAMALNLLFDSGISANSVMEAIHELGSAVATRTKQNEAQVRDRQVPHHLVIEGDALEIKVQDSRKAIAHNSMVHHYQIYEVERNDDGQYQHIHRHDFFSLGHHEALKARISDYLNCHYRLEGQTIFLGSDAGPGYEPAAMLELVPALAHGEYVVDRYHCLKKIRATMRDQPALMERAIRAVRQYDQDQITVALDTYESIAQATGDVARLRAYLKRNWPYLSSPKQRHHSEFGHLGTIESTHRAITYRMKKQGKRWSTTGAQTMIALLESRTNDQLDDLINQVLRQVTALPQDLVNFDSKISIRVRDYLRPTAFRQSCGAAQGAIYLDAATSSPMGRLAKIYNA